MEKLSELEGVVLGILWRMGPQTAYAIRQVFARSASPRWASSAGTIYPLVQRLEARKLIRSEAHATGLRQARKYSIAPAGMKALRRWLGPPLPELVVDLPVDPLRTRIWYLGLLAPEERIAFVQQARRGVKENLEKIERQVQQHRADPGVDAFYELGLRGIMHVSRSRLAWLSEVESALRTQKKTRQNSKAKSQD